MAVAGSQKAPTTTALLLAAGAPDDLGGSTALLTNRHASLSTFLGAAGVTTGTGYELKAGESLSVDLARGESIYGIVSAGTGTIHVLEQGL